MQGSHVNVLWIANRRASVRENRLNMIKLKLESYKGGREETERDTHTENEKKKEKERESRRRREGWREGERIRNMGPGDTHRHSFSNQTNYNITYFRREIESLFCKFFPPAFLNRI